MSFQTRSCFSSFNSNFNNNTLNNLNTSNSNSSTSILNSNTYFNNSNTYSKTTPVTTTSSSSSPTQQQPFDISIDAFIIYNTKLRNVLNEFKNVLFKNENGHWYFFSNKVQVQAVNCITCGEYKMSRYAKNYCYCKNYINDFYW